MAEVLLKTREDGEKPGILTKVNFKNITLGEAALIVYELEKIKQQLLEIEWDSDIFMGVDEE